MENPVIIFGAKSLGRVALDVFISNGIVVFGFLDDDKKLKGSSILDVSVLGETDDDGFLKLIGKKCEAFIATDEIRFKKHLVEMLKEKRKIIPVNAIHKSANLGGDAHIGHGNLIAASVHLLPEVRIGDYNNLMPGVILEASCELESFIHIGAGTVIGAEVKVMEGVFIGSGVTIISGLVIGKNARIGAGSVVMEDVKAGTTVFGSPAKVI